MFKGLARIIPTRQGLLSSWASGSTSSIRLASTTTDTPTPRRQEQLIKLTLREENLTELEKQDAVVNRRRKLAKEIVQLKKYKPTSPGVRWYRAPMYPHLFKGNPYRPLTAPRKKHSGRNNTGRIVIRGRGGGHKRRIRIIDNFRNDAGQQEVVRIEYDPNRTAHIALLKNLETNKRTYILAADGLRAGDIVESFMQGIPDRLMKEMGGKIDPAILSAKTNQKGNCLPIHMIPIGSTIHNISITKGEPGKMCRAAGSHGKLMQKLPEKKKAIVKLKSGEHRYIHIDSCATLGVVSNIAHQHLSLGKAGRSRWRDRRPKVRGMAMNACDHPHGGGRGKSKGNRLSVSAWGVLAKGYKTRRGKSQNKMKVKDKPRGKAGRRNAR
ncbi:54S ribosomal protein RML2, mitochondrial [Wickerhamomyces ciferrii]|uniref:Large ribosomal subunit protein uL2m n=1 Tax=Wickerhamomyces ciferrii (strain ATCC 14091 / BCRC 22168 / CBS 111 / JCM 3599 / NBRC 0793 / NRRL Y-1031 F-60-10) TaxID=1206466 RepID=K0KM07_WICCF|nr:54S ribosomal protein RML2, mitochondrial [Wickerhamomyces ciferrii]CCH46260.1 54S ribosomal protein RML2, mitochondrial [Wickerhamomyces ciferrii]